MRGFNIEKPIMIMKYLVSIIFNFFLLFVSSQNFEDFDETKRDLITINDSTLEFKGYYDSQKKKLKEHKFSINGYKDSIWSYYYPNGVVKLKIQYKKGNLYNVIEQNNKKGERLYSGSLVNGLGRIIMYDAKGNVVKTILISNNQIETIHYWKSKISNVFIEDLNNPNEIVTKYYKGLPYVSYYYKKGVLYKEESYDKGIVILINYYENGEVVKFENLINYDD